MTTSNMQDVNARMDKQNELWQRRNEMKHKVVYNNCYGGYALSNKAIDWLAEHGSERTRQFIARKRIEANEANKKEEKDCPRVFVTSDSTNQYYVMGAVRSFLERHDPDLVAVVEALGKEVNGTFSDLAIEEIEGDMYNIEEYDGKETVVTPDDTCWTVIS